MTKNIAECVCQPKCHILYHKRKNKIEQIIMVITCPTNWLKISLSAVSYTRAVLYIHSKLLAFYDKGGKPFLWEIEQ